MSDKQQYLGMDIFEALNKAISNGDQLRVVHRKHGTAPTQHMRYAEQPDDSVIQVEVHDNKVTRVI